MGAPILTLRLRRLIAPAITLVVATGLFGAAQLRASEGEVPRNITYSFTPPAPQNQGWPEADAKSEGCITCHTASDRKTMHASPAVVLGCADCHGGDVSVRGDANQKHDDPAYVAARDRAHVQPRYPITWHYPSSANPQRSYTLLNREAPEFIRFVNPSDYRVVRQSCGACHQEVIEAAERSIMATGAMLWGGAAYNNGILPYKNYMFGEAYTAHGEPARVMSPGSPPGTVTPAEAARGALATLYPLPTWHVIPPGDIFRVFERGGRNIGTQFPEIGNPNINGIIQRLEEPGRPDLRQSNRGPGTGIRVAIPVLNIHKTRLNDPFMWFMGTNDQPGDYRNSGCAGCHVVYANDREPRHSLVYAQYGRDGQTQTADPTINTLMQGARPVHDEHGGGGEHGGGHDAGAPHDEPGHDAAPAPHGDEHGTADAAHGGGAASVPHPIGTGARESGHPIRHEFTRAIPTAQCMNCHMHQPNIFLNSYLGYTMWDYESDAPLMWPGPENRLPKPAGMDDATFQRVYRSQHYPTIAEQHAVLDRNPEGAATRGLWADVDFLRNVYDTVNPRAQDTQFADYHGHGWNFRAIFKRDRAGNLLDAAGNPVRADDPEKFRLYRRNAQGQFIDEHGAVVSPDDPNLNARAQQLFAPVGQQPGKAVHMMDIHAEKGLQCADCHFAQDSHGNGLIYGEVANAIEIGCRDCHGTPDALPTLLTSGPAARPGGTNLALLRNADGRRRFEWQTDANGEQVLIQRSIVDPKLEWKVSLVKEAVDRNSAHFNPIAARAKLMSREGAETGRFSWGPGVAPEERAHRDPDMACFTCHLSWTTSCGGCHLPIEANWKTSSHKYDGIETRNFATYNPQVARDDMFQLGIHQTTKPGSRPNAPGTFGGQIAPVRSTSALILSSTNINRERIYIQQPPISGIGFSSQAFAPHFPHTVRKTETKGCSDCHLSAANDNNAVMTQLLLLGTNFVNFVGMNAWTGLDHGFQAIRVTEWDEPQAVLGSYLHRYAYPDYYRAHVERNGRELKEWRRGEAFDENGSGETHAMEEFANTHQGTRDAVRCLQLRGEYMFVAEGRGGFRAYDVASIANKGFSERIITAPVSALGQDVHIASRNATCMALPTMQSIAPTRSTPELRALNQEQPFHESYHYAFVTDSEEGLIVVNVDTLADGDPRNNFFRRAATWNEGGVLAGARHITLAGNYAYITTTNGLAVVDITDPIHPKLTANIPLRDARASAIQFRYLWVTTANGLELFDVTELATPRHIPEATVPLADARRIYIARTYAYVAAKQDGLVIVNITNPEAPSIYQKVTFDGKLNDAEDVVVGTTNASLFAHVADGRNGLKVIQLTSPASQPNFYGFSPAPMPELIAWARTNSPALALSKGLDRDRAVDETGGQMAIFGRLGSRPFTRPEMERLFLNSRRIPYKVVNRPTETFADWVPAGGRPARTAGGR